MSPTDIQIFDINKDGFPDFTSQNPEYITDFPSNTNISINQKIGVKTLMTIYNFDNHNDNSTLIPNQSKGRLWIQKF